MPLPSRRGLILHALQVSGLSLVEVCNRLTDEELEGGGEGREGGVGGAGSGEERGRRESVSAKRAIRVGAVFVAGEWREMEDVEALVREALAARAKRQPRLEMPVVESVKGTLEDWKRTAVLPRRKGGGK